MLGMFSTPIPGCLAPPDTPTLPLHLVRPGTLAALRDTLPATTVAYVTAAGYAAKPQELLLLPGPSGLDGALLGLGEAPATPWSFGALAHALPAGTAWQLPADTAAETAAAAVLGWCLGAYRYRRFKPQDRAPARLLPPTGTDLARIQAEAICHARDLINTPANLLGPQELAAAAQRLAQDHGGRCEVITGEALQQGFPCLQAVGAGSDRPPAVAVLEWGAPDAPLVALCGKGVCFDTGGLDLKPSAAMLRMKKDMGGAAIVLAAAEMVMRAQLPVRLLVLVGAVENAVSGRAFRPMDVLRTRAGLTVEIGNTDAEGRLVLADLLTYAAERKPALLMDCATLTGAARVALGPELPAMFSSDDDLAETLIRTGSATYDPVWRLPLHDAYNFWLDSIVADLNNVSTKPMAGAIIAALFLQRFVPKNIRWAHFDAYAWNDSTRPGRPEGGEAQTARLMFSSIASLFCRNSAPHR